MGLRAHDLLCITDSASLLEFDSLPAWALESLRACSVVVVRRATAPDGFVSVGIRGRERSQRAAALLCSDAVGTCISPEELAARKLWIESGMQDASRWALPQFQALRRVAEAAEREALVWGPTGSIGFELATGTHVIGPDSDLDILVRFSPDISMAALRRFRGALVNAPVYVDFLLECGGRAAALDEYLESPGRVLIKTPEGAALGVFNA